MRNKHDRKEKMDSNTLQSIEHKNTSDISMSHLSFTGWADILKKLGDELQSTVKETEEEFLSIGSSLNKFYNRAENISKMSSHIAHLFSGEEISDSIDRLNRLVTQMNDNNTHSRDETEQRIEKLKYLSNLIVDIHDLLENTGTSVKSLKILGMTSRIHSNNLMNFNVLAADVKRLAADMTLKTASMTEGLKSLSSKIRETLSKVFSLSEIQQNKAQLILENSALSLSSLSEKHILSKTIAEDISRISEETSQSITEVVKSLQFHDIIYQQINQIKESFYSLHERIEIARYEENFDNDAMEKLISETGVFCDFQANKLCQYRDKMTSAVNNSVGNLHIINRNIMDITRETKELTGDSEEKKQTFLSETKKGLSTITSAISVLADNVKASKELSKSLSSIVLDEISLFLKDIGLIQDEIELIALNAAVKAANMEKGGEVLNVIAESVHKLSIEVRIQTDAILHIFKSMTSITEELSVSIDHEKERDEQVYEMAAEFEVLTNAFNRINTDITTLLTKIDMEGQKLSEDIEFTIKGININNAITKICNEAIAVMEDMALSSYAMVPAMDSLDKERIASMMQNQLQSTGRKKLEKKYSDTFPVEQKNISGEHFEDNVELF